MAYGGDSARKSDKVAGPWIYAPEIVRSELERYLDDASRPDIQELPTRCPGWDVRTVTVHLVCTFTRFGEMLARGRSGDFSPPFAVNQLAAENQRAVRDYAGGDPCEQLRAVVTDFCADLTEGEELMPHQHGPIPVGLQVLFGISELAIHHDDVAVAAGHRYLPPARTLAVLGQLSRRWRGVEVGDWTTIVLASGRLPPGAS